MNIAFTFKNFEASDHLKKYARRRMEKMGRFFGKASGLEVGVVLTVDKFRHRCEVTIAGEGLHLSASEQSSDMYAAIDVAAAKVLRQLRKYKTRVIDYRMRETLKVDQVIEPTGASLDELMAELSADDEVVRVKEIEFTPMTEEEAMIQIDLLGHDFLVYTDRDTNEVNVMYRRTEGGYGLLKPKAE